MISDQQARDRIVTDLATSFAVDAGAGTGKTTLLIDRLIAVLLKEEVPLPRIAAITFTDKAAGELIERLREKLEKEFERDNAPEELLRKAMKDLEQASVSTIHSFCSSILREYPVEAEVDPQFVVLDQVQADALENQTWEAWLKKALANRVDCLMIFFKLGGNFGNVETLKEYFLKSQSLLAKPSERPLPDPMPIRLELEAFYQKIPGFLSQCLEETDTMFMNLVCFAKQWETVRGSANAVDIAVLEMPSARSGAQDRWEKGVLKSIKAEVKALEESWKEFAAQVKDSALQSVSAWLWTYLENYAQVKTGQGFLDFDDLLSKTKDLLKNRGDVREEIKIRFDRLFVDEFQDTDPLQVEIVFFLSEKKKTNSKTWQAVQLEPGKLFLVGDPQQSIYRFRRADVEIYGEAKAKLAASGGKVERLTENFRTLSPIVEWVNDGFEKLFANGLFPYNAQNANRVFDKNPAVMEPLIGLEIPELPEAEQTADGFRQIEARTVASFIDQILKEKTAQIIDPKTKKTRLLEAGDIAILFRELSNTEAVYEDAFRSRGIQFQIVGGKKFYNRPEIVVLETLLSCLESPADEAGLVALLRSSLFGFTDEQLFLYRESGGKFQFLQPAPGEIGEAFERLREWYSGTRDMTPAEALLYLYDQTNLLAVAASQPHGEQRVANLMKVVDQCRDLETSQNFTYRAFVKWLSRQREEDAMEGEAPGSEETGNQVTLMTLHKSKGLEFPVVILSGAAKEKPKASNFIIHRGSGVAQFKAGESGLGFWTSDYEKAKDEELNQETAEILRLLYVGCTRAKDSLILPLFPQEKGGEFLKALTTQCHLDALKRTKVILSPGDGSALALAVNLKRKDQDNDQVRAQIAFISKREMEKKELVEKLKNKKRMDSVTSLVHGEDDKAIRESYRMEGDRSALLEEAQTREKSFDGAQGKAFGILTHQLLEKGWNWDKATLVKAARLWALGLGLTGENAEEAALLAEKALTNNLLKRAKGSTYVFKELSLTGKTAEGKLLNAVIDLAFLEADEWIIVDYKTDRDPRRGQEAYRRQLNYYGQLLEEFTHKKVKEKHLYFLRDNQVIS
jgi:ATP-dependent exoDNAse (exonuclease V) beta subunit